MFLYRLQFFLLMPAHLLYILCKRVSDDDDGNQDVKKAIGLLRKTTTLHVHHAFCTFLYRPCSTTT